VLLLKRELMRSLLLHIAILGFVSLAGGVLAGCSGGQAVDEQGRPTGDSFGLLAVNYLATAGTDAAETAGESDEVAGRAPALELTAAAQFVSYSALSTEQLARLLALPLDPERDLPAPDTCRIYELSAELSEEEVEGEGTASVDLLEAGELHVQLGSQRSVTLIPRYFPGLLPFVSGVVYSEAQATTHELPGTVIASSGGGEMVGAFVAEARGPERLALTAEPDLGPDQRVQLRWQPAQASAPEESQPVTYVELRDANPSAARALRCRVRDDGAFDIEPEWLGQLGVEPTANLAVEAGRFRQHLFDVRGLDQAELRLSTSERLTISSP